MFHVTPEIIELKYMQVFRVITFILSAEPNRLPHYMILAHGMAPAPFTVSIESIDHTPGTV